mgnify:FL=1|jgi:hypothetical protein|tara:strand:- start:2719 stop:2976 length:258 start_codon:yes stop_codon:yes gene_type:complete
MPLFHPLQEDINNLSDEDISKKIRELTRKRNSVLRFSRNPNLLNQLQIALETYTGVLRTRRIKDMQDKFKKSRGEPDLGELINIE